MRHFLHSLLALTIILLTGLRGVCQETSPPHAGTEKPLAEQVQRLIPQLADPQRRRRELASDELEAVGLTALPMLEAALASAQGEAAWRLRLLCDRLADRAVAAAIEPTQVPRAPAGVPLAEAFEALFKSPGGRLLLAPTAADSGLVSAAADPRGSGTYWEELERLLAAADCRIDAEETATGGVQIRPREAGEPQPVAAAAGPLRIEVLRAAAVPPEQPQAVRLTLRVLWEPRMQPIMLQLPMVSLIAEGAAGEVIPPQQRIAVVEASPRGAAGSVTVSVLLAARDVPLEAIASLRGTLTVWVAAGDVDVRLPIGEPGRPTRPPEEQQLGDARVRLIASEPSPEGLRVRAQAEYPPSEALASHRTWITDRPLSGWLDGQPLAVASDRVVRRDDSGLTREAVLTTADGMAPAAIGGEVRWRLPLAIRKFPVDFQLRAIPLPYSSDARNGHSR